MDSLEKSSANSRDPALPTPGTRTSMSEKAHRGREVQRASGRGSLSLPRGQEPSSLPEAPLELGLRGRSTWQHWSLPFTRAYVLYPQHCQQSLVSSLVHVCTYREIPVCQFLLLPS